MISLGKFDRAIADLTMAIRLKPDFVDAYFQRAYAYYAQGGPHRAITEFSAVLRLAPDVSGGYIGRGSGL